MPTEWNSGSNNNSIIIDNKYFDTIKMRFGGGLITVLSASIAKSGNAKGNPQHRKTHVLNTEIIKGTSPYDNDDIINNELKRLYNINLNNLASAQFTSSLFPRLDDSIIDLSDGVTKKTSDELAIFYKKAMVIEDFKKTLGQVYSELSKRTMTSYTKRPYGDWDDGTGLLYTTLNQWKEVLKGQGTMIPEATEKGVEHNTSAQILKDLMVSDQGKKWFTDNLKAQDSIDKKIKVIKDYDQMVSRGYSLTVKDYLDEIANRDGQTWEANLYTNTIENGKTFYSIRISFKK